jgi:hypothetical protein
MVPRAPSATETKSVTLTPSFEIAQSQLWTMRWILLFLFGLSFAASTVVTLVLVFLVGYGEITLPQELLIALATATVANIFPGLTYILAFAFGKIAEE